MLKEMEMIKAMKKEIKARRVPECPLMGLEKVLAGACDQFFGEKE